MNAYLDRQSTSHATFQLEDGRVWDVFGDNWAEMLAEAAIIIEDCALDVSEIQNYSGRYPVA
jgi:hypothetical protein